MFDKSRPCLDYSCPLHPQHCAAIRLYQGIGRNPGQCLLARQAVDATCWADMLLGDSLFLVTSAILQMALVGMYKRYMHNKVMVPEVRVHNNVHRSARLQATDPLHSHRPAKTCSHNATLSQPELLSLFTQSQVITRLLYQEHGQNL
jgi:hypothetical protein